MMKWSFGLTVVSVAVFLCLNISTPTEARAVKNEKQVKPGQLVNMESVAPPYEDHVVPPGPPKVNSIAPPNDGHVVPPGTPKENSVAPPNEDHVVPPGPPKESSFAPPKENIIDAYKEYIVAPPDVTTVPLETMMDIAYRKTRLISDKAVNSTASLAASPAASPDVEEPQRWCIAKPFTNDTQLDKNVRFACTLDFEPVPFNCSAIQPGGSCYNPGNKFSTASVAMNLYYQSQGQLLSACYFNGSGLIISEDPSSGGCTYPPY